MAVKVVSELFRWLDELEGVVEKSTDERLKETCAGVSREADQMGCYLHGLLKQLGREQQQADELGGALHRGVRKLVAMRVQLKEKEELKKYVNQLKLADAGVDPRPIELPPPKPMKHSSSYEDFKKQRLQQGSTPPSPASGGAGQGAGFGIRSKARSDPDISRQNLQKDLEAFKVDVQRLRVSEKKLLKDNLGLGRKCKILTEERDRAEDRLKIEQTQRDSIERLRQRNKELEEQVQKLRQRQVIKEREAAEE